MVAAARGPRQPRRSGISASSVYAHPERNELTNETTSGGTRTTEQVRRDIHQEREHLVDAVDALREGLDEAKDVVGRLKARLPLVVAGALVLGFVAAGGVSATVRLAMHRTRRGRAKADTGRLAFVRRRRD